MRFRMKTRDVYVADFTGIVQNMFEVGAAISGGVFQLGGLLSLGSNCFVFSLHFTISNIHKICREHLL